MKERLKFVAQSKYPLDKSKTWNDEFWSYNPAVFYKGYNRKQLANYLEWRAVLRIVETKTFKQIQTEQRKK